MKSPSATIKIQRWACVGVCVCLCTYSWPLGVYTTGGVVSILLNQDCVLKHWDCDETVWFQFLPRLCLFDCLSSVFIRKILRHLIFLSLDSHHQTHHNTNDIHWKPNFHMSPSCMCYFKCLSRLYVQSHGVSKPHGSEKIANLFLSCLIPDWFNSNEPGLAFSEEIELLTGIVLISRISVYSLVPLGFTQKLSKCFR